MTNRNRREFLEEVGRGVLLAGLGGSLAADLGVSPALADEAAESLSFGKLEPLVCLMQETEADRLLPLLAKKLQDGQGLSTLVGAAALANARTFGGEDYIGFHTMMALAPAWHMSRQMPADRQALPVFKVLHRNARRIQEKGGRKEEVLHPVKAGKLHEGKEAGEVLLEAVRRKDAQGAEATFAAVASGSPEDALADLLVAVEDCQEVHRIVLPYRAWDLLPVVGREHAHTMLRQSVRYCVKSESPRYRGHFSEARELLPKLLDQHRLVGMKPGTRTADDGWVEKLSETIFRGPPAQAAGAVAEALAEGFAPNPIVEAISLATNQLVLRDNGRTKSQAQASKPVGSVHGDGIGVHACDSANAWRNLSRVGGPRHMAICLILGAHQACRDRSNRGGDFLTWDPYPRDEARERVKGGDPRALLQEAEAAIRNKDQGLASACIQRYGTLSQSSRPVFDLLLKYAVSQDGALHAEKYYQTVTEEFAATRPAFRWRQLTALARVTASAYGETAPGYEDTCRLLKV